MKLTDVAIVAVDGFSPFHYSVPCIFILAIASRETETFLSCRFAPNSRKLLTAPTALRSNASADFTAREQADIVVVPYWGAVHRRPPSRC